MNGLLLSLAGHMIGPISGILTVPVMDGVDDVLRLTAKWPDWCKRLLVAALVGIIPVLNAQFPILHLPTDPSNLLMKPEVQSLVALAVAFILKGKSSKP